jgi:hypothetical protein
MIALLLLGLQQRQTEFSEWEIATDLKVLDSDRPHACGIGRIGTSVAILAPAELRGPDLGVPPYSLFLYSETGLQKEIKLESTARIVGFDERGDVVLATGNRYQYHFRDTDKLTQKFLGGLAGRERVAGDYASWHFEDSATILEAKSGSLVVLVPGVGHDDPLTVTPDGVVVTVKLYDFETRLALRTINLHELESLGGSKSNLKTVQRKIELEPWIGDLRVPELETSLAPIANNSILVFAHVSNVSPSALKRLPRLRQSERVDDKLLALVEVDATTGRGAAVCLLDGSISSSVVDGTPFENRIAVLDERTIAVLWGDKLFFLKRRVKLQP